MNTAPDTAASAGLPQRSARFVVAVLCFGGLCAALMQTLVIPIQGELPRLLHTSVSNASWVVTATLLGGAVAMPVAGRLADIVGKPRVLVASAAILIVGSVVCALADTLAPMLVGRTLQGIAMGYIPVAISLVREVTPPRMAATAIAALSATLGVGGAIGLPLSAWVVQTSDWHLLFWLSAGLSVLVLLASMLFVPSVRDAHPARFDVVGAVGLAVGLVTALVGLSKASSWGWGAASTWGCIGGGLLVLALWARHQSRRAEPLVDLRATVRRPVLLTNVAAVLIGVGMMAQSIVIPQLLEMPEATGYGLGQSLLQTGLWMAPGGLMMMLMAPVSSRLITTLGAKVALAIGGGVLGVGYLVALFLMGSPWELLVATVVCSAGVGIGYAAMPTLILQNVPRHESGSAVGVNTLARSVGTTLAGALMATLLTSRTTVLAPGAPAIPTEGAFRLCFLFGALAAFVGAAVALTTSRGGRQAPAEAERELATSGAR
ncbi:MAG TPA: MFS transporter [Segeticoccus sp.]|nr:MFS transporter [Segeticoccus sp.]